MVSILLLIDSYKAISDEGMPIYQRPFMKGKLYIHFTVEFPESLSPDQTKAIEAVLPKPTKAAISDMEIDDCEETTLHVKPLAQYYFSTKEIKFGVEVEALASIRIHNQTFT